MLVLDSQIAAGRVLHFVVVSNGGSGHERGGVSILGNGSDGRRQFPFDPLRNEGTRGERRQEE